MRKLIKLFIVQVAFELFISASALADDGYSPPVSFQSNVLTYTVKPNGSYTVINEASRRIETKEGASNYGEVDISFIPKLESVEIQDAYTILPNGKRIMVLKKDIRTTNDELERGGASYSDSKHKIIIYPNVVVGSRLYYRYNKIVHTPIFPNQFSLYKYVSPLFKFERFEVNLNFPPKTNLRIDSKGFTGGRLPDKNGMIRYGFHFTQDKFTASEPRQIAARDYAPFVQATTYQNYEEYGREFEKKTKPKMRVTPNIQKLADELTTGVVDKKAQTRILYNWVTRNIRYVGSYIGNGGFVPHDSQSILNNKWGDCKDHVVILGSLLLAKGIESSPALIDMGNSYQLPKLPADVFNHVITYVPSLDTYLDSTDQFAPFGELPVDDLDKQVILTGMNKMGRTPAMKAEEQKITAAVLMKVLPDGKIQGTSHTTVSGDSEIDFRELRFHQINDSQDRVSDSILDANNLTGVGQVNSSDPTDLDKPLEISSEFTLDPVARVPGPAAMFIPAGLSLGVFNGKNFPKPNGRRSLPKRCESLIHRNHFEIEFPASVKIMSIPENVSFRDATALYTATYHQKNNIVMVDREVISQHPSLVCGEDDNERDKKFFPIFQRDMMAQIIYE